MNKEQTIQNLNDAIKAAQNELDSCKQALVDFLAAPECNVYESLEEAEGEITERLSEQAFDDCEGAYNCGADHYDQLFMVDGKTYEATVSFEYDRHDKMYYYIDGKSYSYKEL